MKYFLIFFIGILLISSCSDDEIITSNFEVQLALDCDANVINNYCISQSKFERLNKLTDGCQNVTIIDIYENSHEGFFRGTIFSSEGTNCN